MNSVEQRLQMKREPLDKWSVKEQLCLASAVARSGDQNWMSVSRALKPFGDQNRPSDWFHQKNCAAQYGSLLANVETPKRKKRTSGGEYGIETPVECILKQLKAERIAELKKLLAEEKAEYLKLQENMTLLTSGKFTEDQLDKWCKEIDEEEFRKEQETQKHAIWLKERETKKQEIERVWRPTKPTPTQSVINQKRKNSDSLDSLLDSDHQHMEDSNTSVQESPKLSLALSPLLTSLLKSPSQVQNINQSSVLHSPITNQRPVGATSSTLMNSNVNTSTNTVTNPMIASLLNSTASVAVSPGLQQLVSSAIGQEADKVALAMHQSELTTPDILDDEALNNLKIEEITNSIIVPDGPLPEMKNDVDVIISDLIADPEQHLQLDNNGDININLELDDLEEGDDLEIDSELQHEGDVRDQIINSSTVKELAVPVEKSSIPIDPFEFQEDPEYEPKIPMKQPDLNKQSEQNELLSHSHMSPSEQQLQIEEESIDEQVNLIENTVEISENTHVNEKKKEIVPNAGSVEIVEVAMEEEEVRKVLDKTQIQDIVHSSKVEFIDDVSRNVVQKLVESEVVKVKQEIPENLKMENEDDVTLQVNTEVKIEFEIEEEKESPAVENRSNSRTDALDIQQTPETTIIRHNFSDELYDDIQMEVKIDKSGKAKRDYSRTKKKEEKDFDILLAIEKAHMEDNDLLDDFSDREFTDRKEVKKEEIRSENERSNSPWTEEEDVSSIQSKRRVSTPATPIDSVPNSPASSSAYYDDDKEYRNWKKSIMLVYSWLAAHKYSSLFLKPITEDQAPGYHSLIYRPMDFHTIRKNIENGVIRTTQEFKRDVMLMLNNAIMYNKTNGTVYNMTREIQQEAVESIQLLLQAQSSEDAPPRRETRMSEPGLKRKRAPDDNTRNKKRKED